MHAWPVPLQFQECNPSHILPCFLKSQYKFLSMQWTNSPTQMHCTAIFHTSQSAYKGYSIKKVSGGGDHTRLFEPPTHRITFFFQTTHRQNCNFFDHSPINVFLSSNRANRLSSFQLSDIRDCGVMDVDCSAKY